MLFFLADRWGMLAAALLALSCAALRRWNARQAGVAFSIFSDGTWQAPGCESAVTLGASSVDLCGVLWLHGVDDAGRPCALMVLPDACDSPEVRRQLRVWFHHVAQHAAVGVSDRVGTIRH